MFGLHINNLCDACLAVGLPECQCLYALKYGKPSFRQGKETIQYSKLLTLGCRGFHVLIKSNITSLQLNSQFCSFECLKLYTS